MRRHRTNNNLASLPRRVLSPLPARGLVFIVDPPCRILSKVKESQPCTLPFPKQTMRRRTERPKRTCCCYFSALWYQQRQLIINPFSCWKSAAISSSGSSRAKQRSIPIRKTRKTTMARHYQRQLMSRDGKDMPMSADACRPVLPSPDKTALHDSGAVVPVPTTRNAPSSQQETLGS